MAASGALGFAGKGWFWERPLKWLGLFNPSLFTVVIKTLTISPIKEKTSVIRRVRIISNGVVNAIRLENPGIKYWYLYYLRAATDSIDGILDDFLPLP